MTTRRVLGERVSLSLFFSMCRGGLLGHFAEVGGEFEAGHGGDVVEGGERFHELADEVGGGAPFGGVGIVPAVPDGDFVDFDVFDGFGLEFDDLFKLFNEEHR